MKKLEIKQVSKAVKQRNQEIISKVMELIKLGDIEAIKEMNLEEQDIDINFEYNGLTLLFKAVEVRSYAIVDYLLKNFANIKCNILSEFNKSQFYLPLSIAIANKGIAIIKALLNHPTTDLNSLYFNSFYYKTLKSKDVDIVNILLLKNLNINKFVLDAHYPIKGYESFNAQMIYKFLLQDLRASNTDKSKFKANKATAINIIDHIDEIKTFNKFEVEHNIKQLSEEERRIEHQCNDINAPNPNYEKRNNLLKITKENQIDVILLNNLEKFQYEYPFEKLLIIKNMHDIFQNVCLLFPLELTRMIFSYIKITDIIGVREDAYKYCYEDLKRVKLQGQDVDEANYNNFILIII